MEQVRIARVGVAHPPHRVTQAEATALITRLASERRDGGRFGRSLARLGGAERRVRALARGTCIEERRIVRPVGELMELGDIEARNDVYRAEAGELAARAVKLLDPEPPAVRAVVSSSCTGYALPGWGSALVERFGLRCDTMRLPVTEAGCAGGVVTIARAADYLRTRGGAAIAAACELCSLSFHAGGDDGNLTSTLLFGDAAGAAYLETGPGPGLRILDSASLLLPGTRDALGFSLTAQGFYPTLSRDLVQLLARATGPAAARLLVRHGLDCADVGAWLLHPGGARILEQLEGSLGTREVSARWSWDSLREFGNTSSASIFDVLRRYLADDRPSGEVALVAAFGPGVAIEMLLVRRC